MMMSTRDTTILFASWPYCVKIIEMTISLKKIMTIKAKNLTHNTLNISTKTTTPKMPSNSLSKPIYKMLLKPYLMKDFISWKEKEKICSEMKKSLKSNNSLLIKPYSKIYLLLMALYLYFVSL
jgi:hypothetical protein